MPRPPPSPQTVTRGEVGGRAMSEPGWVTHAVMWQIYPLGFVGAPKVADARELAGVADAASLAGHDGADAGGRSLGGTAAALPGGAAPHVEHRLPRLIAWLDYAVELGASVIALGPIFASESHGYDTIDYFRIDARLGDLSDFDRLIEEAHSRGLNVLLDGVFNHVGRGFAPLQRALNGGPNARERDWFVSQGDSGGHPQFAVFEGHDALVTLNHAEPEVADFVVSVMTYWLGRGADGWRLDAAYAVPAAFWASVLPRVRAEHPNAYIFGEVIHGDYSEIVEAAGFDSLTQYEVWKAIWSSINDANFFELAYALGRHNGYLERFVPLTFVGNHDVTRLATVVDDRRHQAHALVVLLTIGGTPSIYYGDEQGYLGVKEQRAGGDDAIRPEFPEGGPSRLGGGGSGSGSGAGSGPGSGDGWPTYRLHQNLIGLRRRHSWLHSARTETLKLTNAFFAYQVVAGSPVTPAESGPASGESSLSITPRLVVLLNLADEPYTLELPGAPVLLAGAADLAATSTGVSAVTPANGWAILEG